MGPVAAAPSKPHAVHSNINIHRGLFPWGKIVGFFFSPETPQPPARAAPFSSSHAFLSSASPSLTTGLSRSDAKCLHELFEARDYDASERGETHSSQCQLLLRTSNQGHQKPTACPGNSSFAPETYSAPDTDAMPMEAGDLSFSSTYYMRLQLVLIS